MAANTVQKGSLRKTPVAKKLGTPFSLKWPTLDQDNCTLILEEIKSTFPAVLSKKPVQRKRREVLEAAKSKGTLEEPDCQLLKDIEERRDVMAHIVVGINEVTRALEKDELKLALVCRSLQPAVMTTHLMLLGATRQTPVLGIHNLSAILSPLLRVKHAAALGFKKETVATVFSPLVDLILPKVPPILIPWLDVWHDGKKNTKPTTSTSDCKPLIQEDNTKPTISTTDGKPQSELVKMPQQEDNAKPSVTTDGKTDGSPINPLSEPEKMSGKEDIHGKDKTGNKNIHRTMDQLIKPEKRPDKEETGKDELNININQCVVNIDIDGASGLKRQNSNEIGVPAGYLEKKQKTEEISEGKSTEQTTGEINLNTVLLNEDSKATTDNEKTGNEKRNRKRKTRSEKGKKLLEENIRNVQMTYIVPKVKFLESKKDKKKDKMKKKKLPK